MIETTIGARDPREIEADIRTLQGRAATRSPARLGAACVLIWHQELWSEEPQACAFGDLANELRDVRPLVEAFGADFAPLAFAATVLADLDQLATADAMLGLLIDRGCDEFGGGALRLTRCQ